MRENLIQLMSELKIALDLETQRLSEREELHIINANELTILGQALNIKRKQLQLDIQSLEWQTGLSSSTLKRLFKDPSQVKFASVILVADALGVKLCFAK